MGLVKMLVDLADEREELIIRLAELAGILRTARRAGVAVPVVCLLDCDARHWIRWGNSDRCTNCGTPVLPADVWHRLLVGPLRSHAGLSPVPSPRRRAA